MYGCDRDGAQHGPNKLRDKGILNAIKKHKNTVYDLGNIYIPEIPASEKYTHHKKIKYLKPIVDMNNSLAQLVYSALCSKNFPLVIGGDHSLGIGSISGASRFHDNLAVIWIDAHGDINTYETSPSSNAHGMPLSAALGKGEPSLINVYYDGAKVKPQNVYIIGARDLDKGEIQLAQELSLNLYTMDHVRRIGIDNTIEQVLNKIKSSNVDGIHLSFDIDVLDKSLVPGTGTPVDNGFNVDDIKGILKKLLATNLVKSMDLVELNPLLDINDTTSDLCIDLVDWIFKVKP
jgi:arginase